MNLFLPVKLHHFGSVATIAITLGVAGCNSPSPSEISNSSTEEKPKVVASTSVLCDITEKIAQDTVDLTCLMDRGSDPHTYEPTPGDRKAIEQAQLVLYNGYKLRT